jgi:hypothetical protein
VRSTRDKSCPPGGLRETFEPSRPITALNRSYSSFQRITDQFRQRHRALEFGRMPRSRGNSTDRLPPSRLPIERTVARGTVDLDAQQRPGRGQAGWCSARKAQGRRLRPACATKATAARRPTRANRHADAVPLRLTVDDAKPQAQRIVRQDCPVWPSALATVDDKPPTRLPGTPTAIRYSAWHLRAPERCPYSAHGGSVTARRFSRVAR